MYDVVGSNTLNMHDKLELTVRHDMIDYMILVHTMLWSFVPLLASSYH